MRAYSLRIVLVLTVLLAGVLPAQTERWVRRYNGPGSIFDDGNAIVYGPDGNVYVAGMSYGASQNEDFVVVSYTSTGIRRWVYRLNPGDLDDAAYAIVVGPDGNIYAAGRQQTAGAYDIAVASIKPDDGSERWVYHYNGTGGSADEAYALACDSAGNLFVAGRSVGVDPVPVGSFASYDFVVISVTDSGTERWVYRYDGPGHSADEAYSVACGSDGNVYAAGVSTGTGSGLDFFVASINDSGTERWVYRYDGTAHSTDGAFSVAYGGGSVYAAGRAMSSGTDFDFTVAGINATTGAERWVYLYDGTAHSGDEAKAVILGRDNYVYATGFAADTGTGNDILTVSLSTLGAERWALPYDGPGHSTDEGRVLVYGVDGYLYAAGSSAASSSGRRLFTVLSLQTTGTERWAYSYVGPGTSTGCAYALVQGLDSMLYATGYSDSALRDITTLSLETAPIEDVEEPRQGFRDSGAGLRVAQVRPDCLKLRFLLPEEAGLGLSLLDVAGRKVAAWRFSVPKGVSEQVCCLPALSPGVYTLRTEPEIASARVILLH